MVFGFTLFLLVLIAESKKACTMAAGFWSENERFLLSGVCGTAVSNIQNIQSLLLVN